MIYPTKIDGKHLRAYKCWSDMVRRVTNRQNGRDPSYIGCKLSKHFENYQNFANWFYNETPAFARVSGFHLDKDVLSGDTYSEHTCLLIPQEVNAFITFRKLFFKNKGLGVTFDGKKYISRVQDPYLKERKYLGYFDTEIAAYRAWFSHKVGIAEKHKDLLRGLDAVYYAPVIAHIDETLEIIAKELGVTL